jgi:hypothetical protein
MGSECYEKIRLPYRALHAKFVKYFFFCDVKQDIMPVRFFNGFRFEGDNLYTISWSQMAERIYAIQEGLWVIQSFN